MAALLVLLLLLAVIPLLSQPLTYYVTAHDAAQEQSCPPRQKCKKFSYYISQPDSYFTNDTTIIF